MTKVFVLTYLIVMNNGVTTASIGPFIAYSECDKSGQQIKDKFGGMGVNGYVRVWYECLEMSVAPRH